MMKRIELPIGQIQQQARDRIGRCSPFRRCFQRRWSWRCNPLVGEPTTVGSSDKSALACSNPLVAEEAEATASSGLIAAKCHDGRFLMFTLLYLLLAFSSFCLPLCFAFCVPLATLPLFR